MNKKEKKRKRMWREISFKKSYSQPIPTDLEVDLGSQALILEE
jgi:hypothetical protein